MNCEDYLVNSASLSNALEYLNKHYTLDSRLAFINNKLRRTTDLNIYKTKSYLEELGFLVKISTVENLELVELDEEHLLFCFDHEHD
nr:hypothetical protein [Endozoicomonas sp.]